jgi:large subunit ribosomal protein LX
MKAYEIKGEFRISLRKWQPFTIEVASADEPGAVEKALSLIGSRHRVKRQFVRIEGVRPIATEEVTNNQVKYILEVGG